MVATQSEEGFQQMWEDAKARFKQTTNKTLTSTRPRSLEDVLAQLDQHFRPSESGEDAKMQRVKEMAANLLKLINLLGGLAAQGASMVLGPANMCFNAMDFLIKIPARISKFYDDLERLFHEISTFTKQFKIYQRIEDFATIDVEFKGGIHKLLILFVDICALSIDTLSGSRFRRLKIMAEIALFDKASGVEVKLKEFNTLIQHQSQMSDAITLEHVLKSEHDISGSMKDMAKVLNDASEGSRQQLEVSLETLGMLKGTHDDLLIMKSGTDILVRDVDKRSYEKTRWEQLEELCKKLSISTNDLPAIEKDYNDYQSKIMDRTGSWLEEVDVYQQWVKAGAGKNLQLLLSGPRGSGKTFLAFSILKNFKTRPGSDTIGSDPVSVAFCEFSKVRKAKEAVKDSLKSIAAQLFKANVVYSRNLLKYLEDKSASSLNGMSIEDIWRDVIIKPTAGENSAVGSVLLFDDMDQLKDDETSSLLSAVFVTNSPRLQIIFTGTSQKFRTCLRLPGIDLDSVSELRVEEHNEPDIERFINWSLQSKDFRALRENSAKIAKIAGQIREKLPGIANGNFDHAEQIIRKVCGGVADEFDEDEILRLISGNVLENSDVAVKKMLDELNTSLNGREIEQLNEMLAWTIYTFEYITVDGMRAALLSRFQRLPLQRLEDKISQKYSDLLRIEEKNGKIYIYPTTDDVEIYFRNLERRKGEDQPGNDDPQISMTIEIKNVNRSQVRRFFWDLSKKIVLEDFEFTDPAIRPRQVVTIGANDVDSHLSITLRCFDLLLDEQKEETKVLADYAMLWLPSHIQLLRDYADRGLLEASDRVTIIENLANLLQSAECVDQHLTTDFFVDRTWLNDDEEHQALEGWLRDSASKMLNRKQIVWLNRVNTVGFLFSLRNIAVMIARHWLSRRNWDAIYPFVWITRYVDRLEDNLKNQDAADSTENFNGEATLDSANMNERFVAYAATEVPSIQAQIVQAAEWCKNNADVAEDSIYHERLGRTYLSEDENELALQQFYKGQKFA